MYDNIQFYNIKEGEEIKVINSIIEKFDNFIIIYEPFNTIISDLSHRQKIKTNHVSYLTSKDFNLIIMIYDNFSYESVRYFPAMVGLIEEIKNLNLKPRHDIQALYNSAFGGYSTLDINGVSYNFKKSKEIVFHLNYDKFIFRGGTPKRLTIESLSAIPMLDVQVKILNLYEGECKL